MTSESAANIDGISATSDSSTAEIPDIPATAWAVLGLLAFGRELSGYDIKQWADAILRFFYWSPATSQIYTELRRLQARSLIVSREVPRAGGRDKRVYTITPSGIDALERWQAETDAEPPILKHGLLLRIWLGHLAQPDRLREQIGAHQERLRIELAAAVLSGERAHDQPEWAYPELVARWTCRRIESEIRLADDMLADLDDLTARTGAD